MISNNSFKSNKNSTYKLDFCIYDALIILFLQKSMSCLLMPYDVTRYLFHSQTHKTLLRGIQNITFFKAFN